MCLLCPQMTLASIDCKFLLKTQSENCQYLDNPISFLLSFFLVIILKLKKMLGYLPVSSVLFEILIVNVVVFTYLL